jgi:hypothetical protein
LPWGAGRAKKQIPFGNDRKKGNGKKQRRKQGQKQKQILRFAQDDKKCGLKLRLPDEFGPGIDNVLKWETSQ